MKILVHWMAEECSDSAVYFIDNTVLSPAFQQVISNALATTGMATLTSALQAELEANLIAPVLPFTFDAMVRLYY